MTLVLESKFKIGDTVEIIDEGGDRRGRVGDIGIITGVDCTNNLKLLYVRLTTGIHTSQTCGRYTSRWKLISREWDI